MRLLSDSGVLIVSNQPEEPGVTPQADGSPALDGDVAAAGVQVPEDHHILVGIGEARVEVSTHQNNSCMQLS